MTIKHIYNQKAPTLQKNTLLPELMKSITQNACDVITITDEWRQVIGTVNAFQILEGAAYGNVFYPLSVNSEMIMKENPIIIDENAEIELVLEIFYRHDLSILPVVRKGRFAGTISIRDILKFLKENPSTAHPVIPAKTLWD